MTCLLCFLEEVNDLSPLFTGGSQRPVSFVYWRKSMTCLLCFLEDLDTSLVSGENLKIDMLCFLKEFKHPSPLCLGGI